jgi:hypothetical protein
MPDPIHSSGLKAQATTSSPRPRTRQHRKPKEPTTTTRASSWSPNASPHPKAASRPNGCCRSPDPPATTALIASFAACSLVRKRCGAARIIPVVPVVWSMGVASGDRWAPKPRPCCSCSARCWRSPAGALAFRDCSAGVDDSVIDRRIIARGRWCAAAGAGRPDGVSERRVAADVVMPTPNFVRLPS